MTAETDPVLAAQLRYYRARAAEYDETSYGVVTGEREAVRALAAGMDVRGDVLELAGGTGTWTQEFAKTAGTVTYVDGAPEMLAVAQAKVTAPNVSFEVADIFEYVPRRRYDVVFFAAWLSHVPESRFDAFWSVVDAALAPGGRALFLDESPARAHMEPEPDGELATRTLRDGSKHRIVKLFYEPASLVARLAALGWDATVTPVVYDWFVGEARRAAEKAQRQG